MITTRLEISNLMDLAPFPVYQHDLNNFSEGDGARLLSDAGVIGTIAELKRASEEFEGHVMALTLLASFLIDQWGGERDEEGPNRTPTGRPKTRRACPPCHGILRAMAQRVGTLCYAPSGPFRPAGGSGCD